MFSNALKTFLDNSGPDYTHMNCEHLIHYMHSVFRHVSLDLETGQPHPAAQLAIEGTVPIQ